MHGSCILDVCLLPYLSKLIRSVLIKRIFKQSVVSIVIIRSQKAMCDSTLLSSLGSGSTRNALTVTSRRGNYGDYVHSKQPFLRDALYIISLHQTRQK